MGFMEQNVHLSRGLTAMFVLGDKVRISNNNDHSDGQQPTSNLLLRR